jgi:hypothetical protein
MDICVCYLALFKGRVHFLPRKEEMLQARARNLLEVGSCLLRNRGAIFFEDDITKGWLPGHC